MPPPKRDRVASTERSSGPRPSPSSAAPELAPRPRDPILVSTANVAALLFLLPALSLVHPALYLPASIIVLHTPARSSASLLAPPLLPDGHDNADNQRSVDAARDPSPEDDRPLATKSASLPSLPPRAGGCVSGVEHRRPVAPVIAQPLGQVPPHGRPSSS